MELIGFALTILVGAALTATVRTARSDGRGHTPPVRSAEEWSVDGLPSVNYTLRIF